MCPCKQHLVVRAPAAPVHMQWAVRGVRIRGSQVQTPLQSACRCVPGQDTSPQIAPVGIVHSIEYVSRFG